MFADNVVILILLSNNQNCVGPGLFWDSAFQDYLSVSITIVSRCHQVLYRIPEGAEEKLSFAGRNPGGTLKQDQGHISPSRDTYSQQTIAIIIVGEIHQQCKDATWFCFFFENY